MTKRKYPRDEYEAALLPRFETKRELCLYSRRYRIMLSSTFRRRAVNLYNLRHCQNINILAKYSSESTTPSLEDELKLDYLDGERKGKINFAAFYDTFVRNHRFTLILLAEK